MKTGKRLLKIYVLGNLFFDEDSLPLRILPSLKKRMKHIEFIELDPTESFPEEKHLVIIDTIVGSDKIRILKDLEDVDSPSRYSLHDFDLGFNLKLMKKLGKIEDITIIGLPAEIKEETAVCKIEDFISSLI